MCPKAEAFALSILRDAEASFWDKAEAESYLESETIVPVVWKAGKAIWWRVETSRGCTWTGNPSKVFCDWLREALAIAD